MTTTVAEDERARRLVEAERMAAELFDETGRRGVIESGATEKQVSDRLRDLGADLFGTDRTGQGGSSAAGTASISSAGSAGSCRR